MLKTLAVQNYRTLRDFVIPLGPLNLITGANGSGKSNIYKALRLLADTAQNGVIGSLAPETSLHPDLLPALGRLIAQAARRSQVFVVSHASRLIAALEQQDALTLTLEKELGETRIKDRDELDRPAWHWQTR